MAWDPEKVFSGPQSCALPLTAIFTAGRLAGALHPGPPPGLTASVALEESWRSRVRPIRFQQGFPVFSCSQQGGFRPGAAEPRKGFGERGPDLRGRGSSWLFSQGCPPPGQGLSAHFSSSAPHFLPGALVHEWARQAFCFQSSVSLRSRLDPRPGRDTTHRFAKALKCSIRMFIKYSIYAVCPRSHRPKIKSAV